MKIFHNRNIMRSLWMEGGWGGSKLSALLFSRSFSFPGVSVLSFFGSLTKLVISRFNDCCAGTDCGSVVEWWENYIVYILFFIFIIISSSSSISFVALLNCLCLIPWVSPFVHFSSPSRWGRRGRVSKQLSSAWLPAAGLNYNNDLGKGEPSKSRDAS